MQIKQNQTKMNGTNLSAQVTHFDNMMPEGKICEKSEFCNEKNLKYPKSINI